MNQLKTYLLLAALTALFLLAGQALGGRAGFIIAVVFAGAMNLGAWWFSDKIVLRMHGAREIGPGDSPELYNIVHDLAMRASIPVPRLYIIPDMSPNAFATGRDPKHGAVAVTEGLLQGLNRREVAGVIAHELGHIKNRDTLIMSVAATLAGALGALADMAFFGALFGRSGDDEEGSNPVSGLAALILAPIAAMLIQMAISRSREYLADAAAARFTGDPQALASALKKISSWSREVPMETARPATAHLYISNPLSGGGLAALFSTHPPMEKRVARLEAMAYGGAAYVA